MYIRIYIYTYIYDLVSLLPSTVDFGTSWVLWAVLVASSREGKGRKGRGKKDKRKKRKKVETSGRGPSGGG